MQGFILISGCGLDIVFLIDSSGSIGQYNFNEMVSSLNRAIQLFNLDDGSGPRPSVRIGIATFNDANHPQKQLNDFTPLATSYMYLNGRTDISVAIK